MNKVKNEKNEKKKNRMKHNSTHLPKICFDH